MQLKRPMCRIDWQPSLRSVDFKELTRPASEPFDGKLPAVAERTCFARKNCQLDGYPTVRLLLSH